MCNYLIPLAFNTNLVLWANGQNRMLYSLMWPWGTGPGAGLPAIKRVNLPRMTHVITITFTPIMLFVYCNTIIIVLQER